ncbi:MAG: hypothetical protein IIZ83_05980, partial [Oscillospiraceae bacterium]|nr:hypothetical protein [Oscillospiraceae bacterium]
EIVEEIVEEIAQNENTLTIVYDVVETKSKGSLYGDMPTVVEGNETQVDSSEDVTIHDLDSHSYQTFTGNERDRFAYVSYAFKGWMTEGGEIVTPGSEVAAETLDADGDGVAVLSSAWSGSWKSGSGTPFAKFSLWTNAMSANDCFEAGTLLGENLSSYTPSVGGSIMVALDDEGNTITPDELASPSHGNKGKNVGDIYNNPELNFKENNQGKYMMVSYMSSSISQADEDIRTLASTGLHTSDSESGDVTWKLDNLPTDEEVLTKISSFVSRGMTTMRDETGKRIEADALTTENYAVLWCQVKYQSANNDGWNINGVLRTKVKELKEAVAGIFETKTTETIETEIAETEIAETEIAETEIAETEIAETEIAEIETIETEIAETEIAENEIAEIETIETETVESEIVETEITEPEAAEITAVETAPAAPAVIRNNAPAVVTEIAVANTARSTESEGAEIVTLAAARPAADTVEILDGELPMAAPVVSAGSLHGWALINLICALLSLYILLPLLGMKSKFARVSELQSRESDELSEEEQSYLRRFTLGLTVEILAGILAVVIFALTQNLGSRMLLVDGYTPLMAALAVACGAVDIAARKENSAETARA